MSVSQSKTPFRLANLSDSARIAGMLRAFYAKSGGIYGIPWDHVSAMETIWQTMERGACVVGDHSCAGAIIGDYPYNHSAKIAHVIYWYFTTPRELKIFEALARACGDLGATHINPSSHWPQNTIGRYYQKHGLKAAETNWIGEIACVTGHKD